ncbi:MAG: exosortase-associated EpsI family protein [Verrucomicrobiota bacterium]|jgi:hypothetical protein
MSVRNQKWLFMAIGLALVGGTAVAVTGLKDHQKLGRPGIQATPIAGSPQMKIELPANVQDFTSSNVPEPKVEVGYFPKDTSYAGRLYESPDGFRVSGTIILMGADRTSIHQPAYCLPGQGWHIDEQQEVKLPIAGPRPYQLPVAKWTVSQRAQRPDGGKVDVRGLYVFWFVADNEESTSDARFQLYLFRDLLFTGVLQRWAYVSYFAVCAPGQEDAAFARMTRLITASVPQFQFPPGTARTSR